jgi:sugar fermentation stimulation protein A
MDNFRSKRKINSAKSQAGAGYREIILQSEADNRGAYLILLKCRHYKSIKIGRLGDVDFQQGYYIYVGSALRNLQARIDRHRRKIKKTHWHIDYLSCHTRFVQAFPIPTADSIECELADSIAEIADWSVEKFGCSDCRCASHLFGFTCDPRFLPAFSRILLYFRMERRLKA